MAKIKYFEFSVEIIDHRGVSSRELYRVSSREVLDLVLAAQIRELPQPPQLVTVTELRKEEWND